MCPCHRNKDGCLSTIFSASIPSFECRCAPQTHVTQSETSWQVRAISSFRIQNETPEQYSFIRTRLTRHSKATNGFNGTADAHVLQLHQGNTVNRMYRDSALWICEAYPLSDVLRDLCTSLKYVSCISGVASARQLHAKSVRIVADYVCKSGRIDVRLFIWVLHTIISHFMQQEQDWCVQKRITSFLVYDDCNETC